MSKRKHHRNDFYSLYENDPDAGSSRSVVVRPKRSSFVSIALVFFILLLGVSAWYGYTFFSQKQYSQDEPIDVTVASPASVSRGMPTDYVVTYRNKSQREFPSIQVFAEYPDGFTVLQTTPATTNEKKNFWNMGPLPQGGTMEVRIRGVLSADGDVKKTLSFSLQYEDPLYHSSFTIKRATDIQITDAPEKQIRIDGPSSLRVGDSFTYTVQYADFSDYAQGNNVALEIDMPDGFSLTEQTPKPDDDKAHTWSAQLLQKGLDASTKHGSIVIKGSVKEIKGEQRDVTARLLLKGPRDTTETLVQEKISITFIGGDLVLGLTVAEKAQPSSVQFGDKLPIVISYENAGTSTYDNVTMTLASKGALGSLSRITDTDGKKEGDHITWDASSIKSLGRLEPKTKGTIALTLPLESADILSTMQFSPTDLQLLLQLTAHSEKQESNNREVSDTAQDVQGPVVHIPVLSDARMTAFAKSLTQQSVRVHVSVENTLHEINTINVTGVLAKGVKWIPGQESRTAGSIAYDEKSRTIQWTLNKLPTSVHRIDASFDIDTSSQRDTGQPILTSLTFSAIDSIVSDTIKQTIPRITAQ